MKTIFYVLVILRVVHLQMAYFDKEEWYTRIITLKQGDLRGRVIRLKKNYFLKEVEVYLGIPYAAPPVTSLRFMPPGAPPRWSDTLNAFNMKPACPQMFPNLDNVAASANRLSSERNIFIRRMKQFLKNESEDCLYLNIYVPHKRDGTTGEENNKEKKSYPIILFIHGESFEWNSGNLYDGSVIASYGEVIFVTINFRLGIFGFLKQGLMTGRANYGLSDQIAALQWIKANIAEFGGDASRITVMGHGTGAACVNFLMLSPVADGLFHRAILMAGSALSPWALTETPLHYIQLAGELNCSLENSTNCFQRKRKEDIISAFKRFEMLPFESTFTPVVDEVVVLNSPAEHMEKYNLFSKYDLLAGFNEIESYYLIKEEEFLKFGMLTNEGHRYLDTYIKAVFKRTPDYASQKTVEKYLGLLRENSPIETRNAVLEGLSDMLVAAPLLQTLHYHARTPRNTYFYVFGHHTTSENHIKISNRSIYGDDLPYAFGVPLNGPTNHYNSEYNIREEQLSETVLRYFTNFAKSGNPNVPNSQQFVTFAPHSDFRQNAVRWPTFGVDKQPFMYLGMPSQIRYRYREEYDRFWNQILPSSIRNYDGTLSENASKKSSDTIENDDGNSPPVYELNPFTAVPPDFTYNPYNNFYKISAGSGNADVFLQKNTNFAVAGENVSTAETSTVAVTILIIVGIMFLIVNVAAFVFIFYQRGKLRVRENLFRNRFRCKTISVPDIFETNEGAADIYAMATNAAGKENEAQGELNLKTSFNNWKEKAVSGFSKKKETRRDQVDYHYDTIRVASVKPEAISGKRMKRWPLSRQCSSSTVTVDAHSKVRNWIAQEISNRRRTFSRNNNKNRKTREDNTTKMETITDQRKKKVRKVSIAIDATPTARTGSVLKQIPIEVTKSLDSGKSPLTSQMRPSSSMSCIRNRPFKRCNALISEGSEDYYQRTGTHKSSAHIRLRTPEFLLDGEDVSPSVLCPPHAYAHSRSDQSPINRVGRKDASLYSRVNKETKRLKSFVDSIKTDSFKSNSTNATSHYEDMDETVLQEQSQERLTNINWRNFPKVLPDFPQLERQINNNRLSLPPCSNIQLVDCHSSRSVRIPPAPPPRLNSTSRQNPTMTQRSINLSPDQQVSQITVQLRRVNETANDEEKLADIIQTEGICSSHSNADSYSTCEKIQMNALRDEKMTILLTSKVLFDHIPNENTTNGDDGGTKNRSA